MYMKRRYRDAWADYRKWNDIRVIGPSMGIVEMVQKFEVGLMGLARILSEIVWTLSKVHIM